MMEDEFLCHSSFITLRAFLKASIITTEDVQDKVIEYLNAGTRMVWLIFPRTKTVTVYRSLQNIRVLIASDTLSGEDVVPGFSCQVTELFE